MLQAAPAFSSFSVHDMEQAQKFYATVLGLQMTDMMGMIQLNLANGMNVLIYPKTDHQPATFTVLNFVVTEIEKVVAGLMQKGVQFEHYDQPYLKTDAQGISRGDGRAMAWFKDPAGNIISLIQNT